MGARRTLQISKCARTNTWPRSQLQAWKLMKNARRRRLGAGLESLEQRRLLSSVPFGAGNTDVSEFLLGSVAVNVVFLESNGQLDNNTEDWTDELREGVKENIEEGLQWWVDTLALYSDVHELSFEVDYTLADTPVETKYEPISRNSNDFRFWIEDFFRAVDVSPASGFTTEIRNYNHSQRVKHDTNWSFTIFVVNSENDENGLFGDALGRTTFKRAFAYPGGQFIVMPHHRPPATVAHELAHIFWAHDEYSGGDSYSEQRGYYRTQNTNAVDGNPDPNSREPSLMYSTGSPYVNHQLSQSARETLGWKDSDGDGIFDVLDVQHLTIGTVTFDEASRTARFEGNSAVRTLDNKNTSGSGRDMTINKITDLQYRIDAGPWIDLAEFDAYQVTIDETTPVIPNGTGIIEFRTIDDRSGVTSNRVGHSIPVSEPTDPVDPDPEPVEPEPVDPEPVEPEPVEPIDPDPVATPVLQNPNNRFDVSGDGHVSAIDALKVIIAINDGVTPTDGPPYVDVTGDGFVSSRDVLLVINHINSQIAIGQASTTTTSNTTVNTENQTSETNQEDETQEDDTNSSQASNLDFFTSSRRRTAVTSSQPVVDTVSNHTTSAASKVSEPAPINPDLAIRAALSALFSSNSVSSSNSDDEELN